MARGFWGCTWCRDVLREDALKANPAGLTCMGAVDPDEWFQRSLSHEPQRLSGSMRAIADHSRCWAEGNQTGADECLELEQSKVSAFLMFLLSFLCGQIILVSPHDGLRVRYSLERCVGTVGRSGVAEHEPAWTEGGKPAPAIFPLG